jgi:trimeric autotransporter adhesin
MNVTNVGIGVGIGINTPAYQLHLGSNSAAKPGSNVWTVISDDKTKKPETIKPYTGGLSLLKSLRPVTFQYNGEYGTPNDGEEYVGLVAQEVEKVAARMVKKAKVRKKADDAASTEDEILSVNTGELQYAIINALLELAGVVDSLKTKIKL